MASLAGIHAAMPPLSHFCAGAIGGSFAFQAGPLLKAHHAKKEYFFGAFLQIAQLDLFKRISMAVSNSPFLPPIASLTLRTVTYLGYATLFLASGTAAIFNTKDKNMDSLHPFFAAWIEEVEGDIISIGETFKVSRPNMKKWADDILQKSQAVVFVSTLVGIVAMGILGHTAFFTGAVLSIAFTLLETYTSYVPKKISNVAAVIFNILPLGLVLCGDFWVVTKIMAIFLFCITSSRDSYVGRLFYPLVDRIKALNKEFKCIK